MGRKQNATFTQIPNENTDAQIIRVNQNTNIDFVGSQNAHLELKTFFILSNYPLRSSNNSQLHLINNKKPS